MNTPIKVGLIRCDTHGAYYAALMDKHDALKLRSPVDAGTKPPYSWMNGVAHYYFYGFCADPKKMTVEAVEGFQIVKVWDECRDAAEILSDILDSRPRVCDSFEQVSDGVDLVFIADCNGDGSDHLTLARPGLEKSVATFIDKPMSNSVDDVEAILELSKVHDAPVFSASILRHLPSAFQFRSRLSEIGRVDSGCIRGGGCHIAGQIHSVSLAQAVFGDGIQQVHAMGPGELGVMHLSWGDRKDRPASGVVLHHNVGEQWHCSFHVNAYGPEGAILSHNNINDWHYPFGAANILKRIRKMVLTKEVDDSMNNMVEAVAVVNAGRQSMCKNSQPIQVV